MLWERALFGYLFDDRPLEDVHRALLAYRNDDGGWGHDLEHDIKCPDSHPLALEFLLTINRDTGLPLGDLLTGAPEWVVANLNTDGTLRNPPAIRDYPIAPWWVEAGGQTVPASLTGGLLRLGLCPAAVAESTRAWVLENLTLAHIRANEWLFMAYHAFDYYMNVPEFPDLAAFRQAVANNIVACADAAPEKQYYNLFHFVTEPATAEALGVPQVLVARVLDHMEASQQEDGSWHDEHGLPQWYSYVTILVLLALRRFGRLTI